MVVENGKIIKRNVTREYLIKITTNVYYYNKTNICPKCRIDKNITDKGILYPGNVRRGIDNDGKKTEEWICNMHYVKDYQQYDLNSQNNLKKRLRDRRIGNLSNPNLLFADDCEELTCITFGVKRLSTEHDNYELPIDHDRYPILGIMQTKGAIFNYNLGAYGGWLFTSEKEEKEFDSLILYCMDRDDKNVERIYIIPKEEAIKRKSIGIVKNPSKGWYEKYRIKDKEILERIDSMWKVIVT